MFEESGRGVSEAPSIEGVRDRDVSACLQRQVGRNLAIRVRGSPLHEEEVESVDLAVGQREPPV